MPTSASDGSETLVVQATNMITQNPDFAAGTGWTANSGWAISSGTANATTASTDLEQTPSPALIQNDWYFLAFSVNTATAGSVTPKVGGTSGTAVSTVGRHQEIIQAGAGSLLEFTGSGFSGSLDDVLLVQIGQRLFNSTTAGTYQLHLDLSNMDIGDEVLAMVGTKVRSTGNLCWTQVGQWAHKQPQSNGKISIPVASVHEIEFTLCQVDGTAISVPWEVVSL